MTLSDAVTLVEATLDSAQLRVDRALAREDASHFLLLVLDTSRGTRPDGAPIANGPRLVNKENGEVVRLTVPDAVARAKVMPLAQA
ncbi:hypothetical protein [Jannaschia sp. R86511]|uniref:hypothetical protein n=1 Tax=Jannaschia sp. R86511 TaxID=3093853 RepID=UPI0036D20F1A